MLTILQTQQLVDITTNHVNGDDSVEPVILVAGEIGTIHHFRFITSTFDNTLLVKGNMYFLNDHSYDYLAYVAEEAWRHNKYQKYNRFISERSVRIKSQMRSVNRNR